MDDPPATKGLKELREHYLAKSLKQIRRHYLAKILDKLAAKGIPIDWYKKRKRELNDAQSEVPSLPPTSKKPRQSP